MLTKHDSARLHIDLALFKVILNYLLVVMAFNFVKHAFSGVEKAAFPSIRDKRKLYSFTTLLLNLCKAYCFYSS